MPFGRRRDGALDQLVLWTGKAHIDDLGAASDGVIQCLQDHIGIAFCSPRCRAERADRQNPRRRRTSHQPCMRRDGARDAGAEDVRTFLGSKRVEGVGDGVRKFRVFDVDAGIDHRNRDIGAMGERMRLRQPQFRKRILRRIALERCRGLVLQQIAEIQLHEANAGIGSKFATHGIHRAAVGDAEQAEGRAEKRGIPGSDPRQPMAPRQFIGLRVRQRAVDFRYQLVGDRGRIEHDLHDVAARASILSLASFARRSTRASAAAIG